MTQTVIELTDTVIARLEQPGVWVNHQPANFDHDCIVTAIWGGLSNRTADIQEYLLNRFREFIGCDSIIDYNDSHTYTEVMQTLRAFRAHLAEKDMK